MKRPLILVTINFLALVSSACIGDIRTTFELTSTPSLSSEAATRTPDQDATPVGGAPTTAPFAAIESPTSTTIAPPRSTPAPTATPTMTPTVTPSPAPILDPPSGSFLVDFDSGTAPLIVEFDNTSKGPATSYAWDFGDGSTSTDESPSHQYSIAGTYDVMLSVSGPGGKNTTVMTEAVTIAPGPVASVSLLPAEVTLDIGSTQHFSFTAFDKYGNEATDYIVEWTALIDVGTIDAQGLLIVGTKAGAFSGAVRLDVVGGRHKASAKSDVNIRIDPLATIEVQPSNTVVFEEAKQQFTAIGLDQYGNEIPELAYIWQATGGQINQDGIFITGRKSGNYHVNVSATYGGGRGVGVAEVLIPISCTNLSEIPTSECRALVALFNATGGTSWTNDTDWLVTDTPCSWFGIACSSSGHVTNLDLGNNQMTGTIPVQLGDLSNLTFLRLSQNQLVGSIPADLGNLSNLTDLHLFGNELSGSIPVELGSLSKLGNLSLDENELSGTIPAELGDLSSLFRLALHVNQLSGEIPEELGNLSSLTGLSLNHNELSGSIPTELGNIPDLETLNLGFNQLSGSIPTELGNLSTLTGLHLYYNKLSGSIPVELGNLSNLTNLSLCRNELAGSIPAELGNLSNLTALGLCQNQLSGNIPAELGDLFNLTILDLNNNELSGSIPAQLGNLSSLTGLFLAGNRLIGSIPAELGNLSNLDDLGLIGNELSGNIPVELGNMSNLTRLWLSNNQLSGALPQNLIDLDLTLFHFPGTVLCEPNDAAFQAWLSGISDLQSTEVEC